MIQPRAPCLTIVILAAGASRRLGRSKALVRMGGRSLLLRTVRLAQALRPGEVVVVVPRRSGRLRLELRGTRVRVVENRQSALGLSSSVRLALRHARRAAGVLLLPVDLAGLRLKDLARLTSRWRTAPRRVAARRLGDRGVVPLVWPRRLYLAGAELRGDAGLRDWVAGLAAADLALVDMPSAAADVDTPAQLAAARRRAWRAGHQDTGAGTSR